MKQTDKKGNKNTIGAYGETIAARYVKRKGFVVLEVNYLKKWGEIDIVARETTKKGEIIHFIEVKTVSYETKDRLRWAVSHETWRPEEQMHAFKIKKLSRVIDTWLQERAYEGEWQLDLAAVRVVPREKYATIQYFDSVY